MRRQGDTLAEVTFCIGMAQWLCQVKGAVLHRILFDCFPCCLWLATLCSCWFFDLPLWRSDQSCE
jgi:hypothetical protein